MVSITAITIRFKLMRRKKTTQAAPWLTWEGDGFPRELHSDSVIFYLNEHIYFDSDIQYKRDLARAIQLEGIAYSLGESFRLIEQGRLSQGGYRISEEDPNLFVYCDNDDPDFDYDATFIEVPYVG